MQVPPNDLPTRTGETGESLDWGAQLDLVERALEEVEASLVRLDDGTYATCEVCSARIDETVLEAAPTTSRCSDHS